MGGFWSRFCCCGSSVTNKFDEEAPDREFISSSVYRYNKVRIESSDDENVEHDDRKLSGLTTDCQELWKRDKRIQCNRYQVCSFITSIAKYAN